MMEKSLDKKYNSVRIEKNDENNEEKEGEGGIDVRQLE